MRSKSRKDKRSSNAIANAVAQSKGMKSLASPGNIYNGDFKRQSAPVQRKVFIKSDPFGKADLQNKNWDQKDKIEPLIDDDKLRYFKSKQELKDFADKKTENIGYVEGNGKEGWIRLHEKGLWVLGEDHSKTTLMDIVKATGTTKFKYEAYTEKPKEIKEKDSKLIEKMSQNRDERDRKYDVRKSKNKHEAESFLPKIAWAINSIPYGEDLSGEKPKIYLNILCIGISYAGECSGDTKINNLYLKNAKLLEATTKLIKDYEKEDEPEQSIKKRKKIEKKIAKNISIFKDFASLLYGAATAYSDKEKKKLSSDDLKKFGSTHKERGHQLSDEAKEIFKARDLSIFRHIVKAKKEDFLLFGIGGHHLNNLEDLLDDEKIKNTLVETYINEQLYTGEQTE